MSISCWIHSCLDVSDEKRELLITALIKEGVEAGHFQYDAVSGPGTCIFGETSPEVRDFVQTASLAGQERVIGIADPSTSLAAPADWDLLLQAGLSDVLIWSDVGRVARQIKARLERWLAVEQMMVGPTVSQLVIAKSPVWQTILRDIVEIARFSDASVLVQGESGTGKEIVARLIHLLDSRPNKRDFMVLDCASIVSELSGSEFFGHERGAFTGALTERHGAFALANGGTLFLDEVGELPLNLQAQLLRVVQEGSYKRVGGNTWCKTAFRLVCATNRKLSDLVNRGEFRADLYYRIAGCVCHLPPLRERLEDILLLAEHFLRQAHPKAEPPELDAAVRDYLLRREYPGNVRDLQQLVSRLMYRCAADRSITFGCIPSDDRPVANPENLVWRDARFERVIQRAVHLGAGLKEIGRAAEDVAIRFAINEEHGNLPRAARRLRVTDRALQLRQANRRQPHQAQPESFCTRSELKQSHEVSEEHATRNFLDVIHSPVN